MSRLSGFVRPTLAALMLAITIGSIASSPASAQTPTTDGSPAAGSADLAAVKAYLVDQVGQMKTATAKNREIVQRYYDLASNAQFDYEGLWETNKIELSPLLMVSKQTWLESSNRYELSEGIVAGVPSLSYYDTWIDAGPTGEEDPTNALDWTLTLPNGTELVKPGNFMTHLIEPAYYGTIDEFVGLRVDLDGNGTVDFGEVLPEANILQASVAGLDDATTELQTAVNEWEPTIEDAFTALTTMIPTMNEYFEQWKLSRFVTGDASTETAFVAISRLSDINGIINGLDVTYNAISPAVIAVDPALDAQIKAGFADLVAYVTDLYDQENAGTTFTPEQADLFGAEAQSRATKLVGQVSQAIALLGLQV
jgi:hypothetical protein